MLARVRPTDLSAGETPRSPGARRGGAGTSGSGNPSGTAAPQEPPAHALSCGVVLTPTLMRVRSAARLAFRSTPC
jgi:hypothetical protein